MEERKRVETMMKLNEENQELCKRCACGGRWQDANCATCIRNGWFIDHFREKGT